MTRNKQGHHCTRERHRPRGHGSGDCAPSAGQSYVAEQVQRPALVLFLFLALLSSADARRFRPVQALKRFIRGRQVGTPHPSMGVTVQQPVLHGDNFATSTSSSPSPLSMDPAAARLSSPDSSAFTAAAVLVSPSVPSVQGQVGRFGRLLKNMSVKNKGVAKQVVESSIAASIKSLAFMRKEFLRQLYALLGLRPPAFLLSNFGRATCGIWVVPLAGGAYGSSKLDPMLLESLRRAKEPATPVIDINEVRNDAHKPPPQGPEESTPINWTDIGIKLRDTLILIVFGVLFSHITARELLSNGLFALWCSSSYGRCWAWWCSDRSRLLDPQHRQLVVRGQAAEMMAKFRVQLACGVGWNARWLEQPADILAGHKSLLGRCAVLRHRWMERHRTKATRALYGDGLDLLEEYFRTVSAMEDKWVLLLNEADKIRTLLSCGAVGYENVIFIEGGEIDVELQNARVEHCDLLGVDGLTPDMFKAIIRTGNGPLVMALRNDMLRALEEIEQRQAALDKYLTGTLRALW